MRYLSLSFLIVLAFHAAIAAQAPVATMHLEKYEAAMKAAADAELQGDAARALGNRRAAEEHLEEARKAFETAGATGAADVATLRDYAQVLEMLEEYDQAAAVLERAVVLDPQNALLWARLGVNRAKVGSSMHEPALDALRHALNLNPSPEATLVAQRTLGDVYWDAGLYDFADAAYAAAHEAAPDDVATRIWQAVVQVRNGEIAQASATLDALGRDAQPYDIETRLRLRKALRDVEYYRHNFGDSAENHAAFGKLLYRAARIPEAMVAIERALDLAPEQPDLWNFLAAMRTQLGDAPGAIAAYEKSLEQNADQPNVKGVIEQLRQAIRAQQQQPGSAQVPPAAAPAGDASGIPPLLRAP